MLNVLLMEELEEATAAIQAIVTVAMETILLDNAYIPRQLFETAVVFHGKWIFDRHLMENSFCVFIWSV